VSAGRRLLAVADALPVTVLAVIAGAGSFTHIRDTAARHGQTGPMSWAVAVCIDLTCVMAARERQRDKQNGVVTRRLSWPTAVLAGGVLLSLAANLAQAQPTAWGRIAAAVPPAAFLVAVSMIERRAARRPRRIAGEDGAAGEPSWRGRPSPVPDAGDEARDGGDEALLVLGGPPPSTRTSTGSRSPATRSAPASACPTRPPPSCCASSAPTRASRRMPAPPDPGRLPGSAGAPGPRRPGRLLAWCAREGVRRGGRRLDRHREGVATYRDGLADHGPAARGGAACCRRGGPPAGFPRGGRDGQRNWQTVYLGSPTCDPSMSPANLPANTYSCRQRSAVVAVNAQDVAVINLPVDSQTCISAKLLKQS
jgi:Protein of unknown function (DUF2637)